MARWLRVVSRESCQLHCCHSASAFKWTFVMIQVPVLVIVSISFRSSSCEIYFLRIKIKSWLCSKILSACEVVHPTGTVAATYCIVILISEKNTWRTQQTRFRCNYKYTLFGWNNIWYQIFTAVSPVFPSISWWEDIVRMLQEGWIPCDTFGRPTIIP